MLTVSHTHRLSSWYFDIHKKAWNIFLFDFIILIRDLYISFKFNLLLFPLFHTLTIDEIHIEINWHFSLFFSATIVFFVCLKILKFYIVLVMVMVKVDKFYEIFFVPETIQLLTFFFCCCCTPGLHSLILSAMWLMMMILDINFVFVCIMFWFY